MEGFDMKTIANIAMILALIPAVLRFAFEKQLSPEQVALILVVGVFFIAGGKPILKLVSGVVGLYLFSREITGGIEHEVIFAQLLQLAIMLIGFYIIFRGIFPRSKG
jgi:hypothetical protein